MKKKTCRLSSALSSLLSLDKAAQTQWQRHPTSRSVAQRKLVSCVSHIHLLMHPAIGQCRMSYPCPRRNSTRFRHKVNTETALLPLGVRKRRCLEISLLLMHRQLPGIIYVVT